MVKLNDETFLGVIEGASLQIERPVFLAEDVAYGIAVSRMPHADALVALSHMRATEDEESTEAHPILELYMRIGDLEPQRVGRMHLTLHNYTRMERILSMYSFELCYVTAGNWGSSVPKAHFIHTLRLSGQSIFEHI